jgi:gas vesicle protein
MENKNNNQGGFGNGFVLGLLVGIVATLFITTKRGRELFKELTEKGLDKFSDFEDKFQEKTENITDEYEELEEGNDYVEEIPEPQPQRKSEPRYIAHEEKHETRNGHAHNGSSQKPSPVRRFFRKKS